MELDVRLASCNGELVVRHTRCNMRLAQYGLVSSSFMSSYVKAISKSLTLTLLDSTLNMRSTTLKNALVRIRIKYEVFTNASLFEAEMTNGPTFAHLED